MSNAETCSLSDLPKEVSKWISKSKCPFCKKYLSTSDEGVLFIYKDHNAWVLLGACTYCDEYAYDLKIVNIKKVILTDEELTFYNKHYKFHIWLEYDLNRSFITISEKDSKAPPTTLSLDYIFLNTKKKFNYKELIEEFTTMMVLS